MEEPIDGFWQERGRIIREIQGPLDQLILTKIKLKQLMSKRRSGLDIHNTIATLSLNLEAITREIVSIIEI